MFTRPPSSAETPLLPVSPRPTPRILLTHLTPGCSQPIPGDARYAYLTFPTRARRDVRYPEFTLPAPKAPGRLPAQAHPPPRVFFSPAHPRLLHSRFPGTRAIPISPSRPAHVETCAIPNSPSPPRRRRDAFLPKLTRRPAYSSHPPTPGCFTADSRGRALSHVHPPDPGAPRRAFPEFTRPTPARRDAPFPLPIHIAGGWATALPPDTSF